MQKSTPASTRLSWILYAKEIFMSEPITVRKLVERISSGDIRIPAFQRDFVWEPEQVAFLRDSIYKEFPIGTVILWKTDKRLSTEKKLGVFELHEPEKTIPSTMSSMVNSD